MEQTTFLQVEPAQTGYKVTEMPERERPVNRLREAGPRSVSNTELVACILQSGDALRQAQDLLVQLGGLEGIARAEACMFAGVKGIGEAQAARLLAAIELGRRIVAEPGDNRIQVQSPADAANVLMPLIGNEDQEHFVVLFLNTRNQIVDHEVLYRGSVNTSVVRIAEVFRGAVRRNAVGIIIAHNHPTGDPNPSPEDIALTRRIVDAGQVTEVDVLDHVIVGRTQYVSLRERGLGWE